MKISDLTIKNLKSGKLSHDLPDFYELKDVIENNDWHNNESTFDHTLNVLKNYNNFLKQNKNKKLEKYLNQKVDSLKRKDLLCLAIIFHDFGKKETLKLDGKISTFPLHEKISVLKIKKILTKLKLSASEKKIVNSVISKHTSLYEMFAFENEKLENQFNKIEKASGNYIIELVLLVLNDSLNGYLKVTNPSMYKYRINYYKERLQELIK